MKYGYGATIDVDEGDGWALISALFSDARLHEPRAVGDIEFTQDKMSISFMFSSVSEGVNFLVEYQDLTRDQAHELINII